MTVEQFEKWVEYNPSIEWKYDGEKDAFLFRDNNTEYYRNHPDAATVVSGEALWNIDGVELIKAINQGLNVEQITRVTGYFSKVSHFNKGKRGELTDRHRETGLMESQSTNQTECTPTQTPSQPEPQGRL